MITTSMSTEITRLVDDLVSQFAIHSDSEYVSGTLILSEGLLDLVDENEVKVLDQQILPLLKQRLPVLSREEWGLVASLTRLDRNEKSLCLIRQ